MGCPLKTWRLRWGNFLQFQNSRCVWIHICLPSATKWEWTHIVGCSSELQLNLHLLANSWILGNDYKWVTVGCCPWGDGYIWRIDSPPVCHWEEYYLYTNKPVPHSLPGMLWALCDLRHSFIFKSCPWAFFASAHFTHIKTESYQTSTVSLPLGGHLLLPRHYSKHNLMPFWSMKLELLSLSYCYFSSKNKNTR